MAWIELHQSLRDHPKLRRLAKRLRVRDRDLIRAKLENLWLWALEYRDTGSLAGLDDAEVANASGWSGDPAVWRQALTAEAWLDPGGEQIHDWQEYAGSFVHRRSQTKERVRRHRNQRKAEGNGSGNALHGKHESPGNGLTVPDLTVPNQTRPPPSGGAPPAAVGSPVRASRAKSWRRVPEGEALTNARRGVAERLGIPGQAVEREWGKFTRHEFRRTYTSVDGTWRNWCEKALEIAGEAQPLGAASQGTPPAPKRDTSVESAAKRWLKEAPCKT